jgi:hypothetical protein
MALSQVAPERLHCLSPGRLAAGKISVFDGDPGNAKSTLLCEFAAHISRGDPFPGGRGTPPRAVIPMAAADDLYDTIRPCIDAAGSDPRHVIAFSTFLSAVRHLNDSVTGNPPYRGGASIGIICAAYCGLLLASDPDDPERRILASTNDHLGRPRPRWRSASLHFPVARSPTSSGRTRVSGTPTSCCPKRSLRPALTSERCRTFRTARTSSGSGRPGSSTRTKPDQKPGAGSQRLNFCTIAPYRPGDG